VTAGYLLDKSALARWGKPSVAQVLDPLLAANLLYTCPVIELGVLYSARSPTEYALVAHQRRIAYRWAETTAAAQATAMGWQAELARTSQHRGVGVADLLIAATAAEHGLAVLHYDRDFAILGDQCRAPHQFVVPPGSLDS
jgi:predicted nucleic acid-binding protein